MEAKHKLYARDWCICSRQKVAYFHRSASQILQRQKLNARRTNFVIGGCLPSVRPRPIARHTGRATKPPWPETARLRPCGLRSLPRVSAARSQQTPATEPTGGRAIDQAGSTRGTPGAQRDRDGLTAMRLGRKYCRPNHASLSSSARPVLRSGKSSARRSHPGQSTGDRTLSRG
jgi:hypothetical protein